MTKHPFASTSLGLYNAALIWALPALFCAACSGGHAAHTETARRALDYGDPHQALVALNKELGVKSSKEIPAGLDDGKVLFLLDRAMVLQQMRAYEYSSKDLEVSDKNIEILDFSRKGMHDLGKYLYSDDTGPYKAPAYEKLMINTVNMLNYLTRGDLAGARVEARRFAVMEDYIVDHEDPAVTVLPLGRYVAGYVNEASGRSDEAKIYYKEAAKNQVLGELVKQTFKKAPCQHQQGCGELLVAMAYGRVPAKVAKRIPIGAAAVIAGSLITPADNDLIAQGAVSWVIYPALQRRANVMNPQLFLDKTPVAGWHGYALDLEVERAWAKVQPSVVASAITRALARFAAGKITKAAAGGGLVGSLLSIGTQAGMAAADTPDTRSWSTLPARIVLVRLTLPAGDHELVFNYPGRGEKRSVTIKKDGYATTVFDALW